MNETYNQSPNLLRESYYEKPIISKSYAIVINLTKIIIITTEIFFISIIAFNSSVDTSTLKLQSDISILSTEVDSYKETELVVQDTINRIEHYKKIKEGQKPTADRIEKTLNNIPNDVILTNFSFKEDAFQLNVETIKPLSLSLMISTYLEMELTEEIIIKSVNLVPRTGVYETVFEGSFL